MEAGRSGGRDRGSSARRGVSEILGFETDGDFPGGITPKPPIPAFAQKVLLDLFDLQKVRFVQDFLRAFAFESPSKAEVYAEVAQPHFAAFAAVLAPLDQCRRLQIR